MKVILLQDVARIGKRFSVAEVPDGYALNQLIPKRMAEPATPANLKKIKQREQELAASKEAGNARFTAAKEALAAHGPIEVVAEANEQGHLFKAVHEADVVVAAAAAGIQLESSMVAVPTPIKDLGEHTVLLSGDGETAKFTITVVTRS